ncbi:CHAD domain-containing protein [Lysobacter sp. BMK333-48F3]|uniref:CHAD domain-containing protein n=1 Tax=Lysobacter sp. BMK333-48F3 TaxID=2867962 RepID=UPI001C8B73AA|nr:CHAD domain-containing protein [Lysobacter sp. BMK333-48F3]MBX9400839.1 CHAD domain-containing protein [Lysobacter sp. BMK333-48F3]
MSKKTAPANATDEPAADGSTDAEAGRPPGRRLRAFASRELEAAIDALGWRGNRLHRGVHLARKGLRRVRATLALGGAALGPGAAWIDRGLRDANRDLSALRDAQALVETLERLLRAPGDDAHRALLRRAQRRAASARAAAARRVRAEDPDLAARRSLLRVLRAALRALPWETLAREQWRESVALSLHRVERARQRARRGGDEDWHEWRRRARRLSQQQRALQASGLGEDAPAFDRHRTERLGEAQDLNLLLDHCGKGSPFAKPDRLALRAFARSELARSRGGIDPDSAD